MNEENRNKTTDGLWLNKSLQTKCANLQVGSVSRRPRVWLRSVMFAGVTRSGDDAAQRAAVAPRWATSATFVLCGKTPFCFCLATRTPFRHTHGRSCSPGGGTTGGSLHFGFDRCFSCRDVCNIYCLLVGSFATRRPVKAELFSKTKKKRRKKNNLL